MKSKKPDLALYVRDYCMFCNRVMRAANELGIELEIRNIWEQPGFEQELKAATGRTTVPVLRIAQGEKMADGEVQWMPESSDIVRYLQTGAAASA